MTWKNYKAYGISDGQAKAMVSELSAQLKQYVSSMNEKARTAPIDKEMDKAYEVAERLNQQFGMGWGEIAKLYHTEIKQDGMQTLGIWTDSFVTATTGPRRSYTVLRISLDSVKTVLRGLCLSTKVNGTSEDVRNGYLQPDVYSRHCDEYIPTAKGYKAILSALSSK